LEIETFIALQYMYGSEHIREGDKTLFYLSISLRIFVLLIFEKIQTNKMEELRKWYQTEDVPAMKNL